MERSTSGNSSNNLGNGLKDDICLQENELMSLFEKAWRDSQFKHNLLKNPLQALHNEGINISPNINLIVVAETNEQRFLVIHNGQSQTRKAETLLDYICNKAAKDKDFKQALIDNPKDILRKELAQIIPENVEFTVLEETKTDRYLVIPPQPDLHYAIERACQDSVFKQSLLSEPKIALAQIGIVFPDEHEIKVLEETDFQRHIVLDSQNQYNIDDTDYLASLKTKAYQDTAFKNKLLSNPKEAIEQELDISLPSWVGVKVVEQTSSEFFFVIPNICKDEELEEAELMAVTGGWRVRRIRARGRFRFSRRSGFYYTRSRGSGGWGLRYDSE